MEVININYKLFDLVKKKEFPNIKKIIEDDENIDLDITDNNYNYLIDYLITYDQIDIIKFILEKRNIRLDILDREYKSILYNPIKYNKFELIKILLDYDKKNIGVSILEKKDKEGRTALFYCAKYNNFEAFKLLYNSNIDIFSVDENNINIVNYLLKNEKNKMLLLVLDNEIKKNSNFLNLIKNTQNESLLQNSIIYDNNEIINYLLKLDLSEDFLNNQENEYGLNALHNSIILKKNDVCNTLIDKNIDINNQDYLGNSSIHYAIIENNIEIILKLIESEKLKFNTINLNGNLPLHLFLEQTYLNLDILNEDDKQSNDYKKILHTILKNSKFNIQNNEGNSIVHYIVEKELWKNETVSKIIIDSKRSFNVFIKNNNNKTPFDLIKDSDKESFLQLLIDKYYVSLLNYKDKNLIIDWERYCAKGQLKELSKILRKKGDKNIDIYCKEKIRDIILNEKRNLPKKEKQKLLIDKGIYQKGCFYTGSTIDIIFGLLFIYNKFQNIQLILEYPLVENNKLIDYYKKMGINYNYKLDFSNIEIIWIYQKLIYPTNFDSIFLNKLSNDSIEFITIPLGIEMENGSHANILIIDIKNKRIERFEPNGYYSPREFFFNDDLLDKLLSDKFSNLLPDFNYFSPKKYLPIIGFQIYESLETNKCKKIGDPNGFCAVWCIWWTNYKIAYKNIPSKKLAKMLINKIKFNKLNFKDIIRNFSINITKLRDSYLEKYEIDINKWMNDDYDKDILDNLEKDILEFIR